MKALILALALFTDYREEEHLISKKTEQPTAVAVIAYNRPDYLKELLLSLEKNEESQTLPFFFFLDGGPQSAQEDNIQLIERSPIKYKTIVKRPENFGCFKNNVDSKRYLFDWCGFEKVVVIEEDLIVSPDYLRLLLRFHKWATSRFSNVGTVQMWNYCFLPREEKKKYLISVQETREWWSLVSYCIGKNVWDSISPFLYEYEERFVDPLIGKEEHYLSRSKPHFGPFFEEIKQWQQEKLAFFKTNKPLHKEANKIRSRFDFFHIFRPDGGHSSGSQDTMTTLFIGLTGHTRLETVVNRARSIGARGLTTNASSWKKAGFDRIHLDLFQEDHSIQRFKFMDQ